MRQFLVAWKQVTSDPEILELVSGARIEFDGDTESLPLISRTTPAMSASEGAVIGKEIENLLAKGVIASCKHHPQEVLSPVFTRKKKDGTFRVILNLKRLNEEITYRHFKMDTLNTALSLISKDCFMASVDLKDAYYSVAIHPEHRKFLRFKWKEQRYEYNALPNGLALAPRKFTKLLKPVFATLRKKGHVSTAFLDDSLLLGGTREECIDNIQDTLTLFQQLGFVVHPTKSVLRPAKRIQYLGVIIDSESMTVTLTADRARSLKEGCRELRGKKKPTIREAAQVIGKIVASFPAVRYGPLHYRSLEEDKKEALRESRGDFDHTMTLSESSQTELKWWEDNVESASNDVCTGDPEVVISTDASLIGWGCDCEGVSAGGQWLPVEQNFHINYLELKAALLALKCFQTKIERKHVRLLIDNTTAVACINHMGTSHSPSCNSVTQSLWEWGIDHNVWISAAHIPGKENTVADAESRRINLDAEWKIDTELLQSAFTQLGVVPTIDLFASRLNAQITRYVAFRPDPAAVAVDAFSVSWKDETFYAFPPFSILARVLQKVQQDQAAGVLVVPDWPTQVWYPVLQRLLLTTPVQLPCRSNLLRLPSNPDEVHPLIQRKRLRLLVCRISGKLSRDQD